MKKLFLSLMLLLSVSVFGQQDCVKFLGIPVDGTKEEMIRQLKAKGYRLRFQGKDEYLEGEFNGFEAHIFVHTTKNKVDRIYVASQNLKDEADIRIEYNNLLYSFQHNKKYFSYSDNEQIEDDEDISYEMIVHDKVYQAIFSQQYTDEEESDMKKLLLENYDAAMEYIKGLNIEALTYLDTVQSMTIEDKAKLMAMTWNYSYTMSNQVWFTIHEYYGKYYIGIYYDNLNNRPNGEDL